MSSRLDEKELRKAERLQVEHQAASRQRRGRRLRLVGGASALAVGVALTAALALGSGGSSGKAAGGGGSGLATGEVAGAFGQHYSAMSARGAAVKMTTMMDTMSSTVHFHPTLRIFADGKPMKVPANVGIDPRKDGMAMMSLHTHDDSGTIHVEGISPATLGQFFAVWGVPLSAGQLGSYREPVRMWVNGAPSRAYGDLKFAAGQRIVLAVGPGNPKL